MTGPQSKRPRRQPENLFFLLQLLLLIPLIQILMVAMKLPARLRVLDRPAFPRREFDQAEVELAERLWRYTYLILIRFFRLRKPCQLRSLTLFALLRRRGLDVRVHYGARKKDRVLEGHCWLTLSGQQILEQYDPRITYVETYTYPPMENAFGDLQSK